MDWVEDMLADRNLTISLGNTTIEDKPDEGCVLSPLLWCVMVNNLVEDP